MPNSGQQGIFGVPMEAQEVTEAEIKNNFPTPDVIEKWHKGEEAEWPPDEPIELRFYVGMFVLCRVGPTDWAPGKVLQLWYREPNWPPGSFAPYKIKLADGREIYAPIDNGTQYLYLISFVGGPCGHNFLLTPMVLARFGRTYSISLYITDQVIRLDSSKEQPPPPAE